MLWLAVHLPQFGLEVVSRGAKAPGETTAAPQVLVHDQHVLLANATAGALGVQIGGTLATAQSLLGAGEKLAYFAQDKTLEATRLRYLAEVLYRYSSHVSLATDNGIVMEIGGSLRLFGNHKSLAGQVRETCVTLGHEARVRVARTPLAALALARANVRQLQDVPLQSLHQEDLLAPKRRERFANMGLQRLGDVMGLPPGELTRRFGKGFTHYLARLEGSAPDPQQFIEPAAYFEQSLHLLEPLRDKDALREPMAQLAAELEQWLVSHQLGAERLYWRFSAHTSGSSASDPDATNTARASMSVRFSQAQQRKTAFLGISELKLAALELPDEVLNFTLRAERLQTWDNQSQALFKHLSLIPNANANANNGSPEITRTRFKGSETAELSALVDQLGARLGEQACKRLQAVDQHAPEQAWTAQAADSFAPQPLPPHNRGQRPLWLFSPPRAVRLEDLRLLAGPERLQTAWWDTPVVRDYYVAEHIENGARCWAFVEPSMRWYLHGYFG